MATEVSAHLLEVGEGMEPRPLMLLADCTQLQGGGRPEIKLAETLVSNDFFLTP